MELFLEQASVLGCRFVDCMASGSTKQLIQNSKSLIWQGIELAVDPSTTAALAEVTAHLCHALEELNDSFHPTPRVTRNFQNETTYLSTAQMTQYQAQSIETVILSSLGVQCHDAAFPNHDNDQVYGVISDDNSTISAQSVPSNVAFDKLAFLGESDTRAKDQQSRLKEHKDKVNVKLLQQQILTRGRPVARDFSYAFTTRLNENKDQNQPPHSGLLEDLENEPILTDDASPARNSQSIADIVGRLDDKRQKEEKQSSALRFYLLVDDLVQQRQNEKQHCLDSESSNKDQDHASRIVSQEGRAKVRSFRASNKGSMATLQPRSKKIRDQDSNLRCVWKYPPIFLYTVGGVLALVLLFWLIFGLYGMYTFYQNVHNGGHPATSIFTPAPMQPMHGHYQSSQQNEVVVRIIKEVVHVNQDGSDVTGDFPKATQEEMAVSEEELNHVLSCIANQ
jgi:predicted DNA-binding ribbon-helix-helix protein